MYYGTSTLGVAHLHKEMLFLVPLKCSDKLCIYHHYYKGTLQVVNYKQKPTHPLFKETTKTTRTKKIKGNHENHKNQKYTITVTESYIMWSPIAQEPQEPENYRELQNYRNSVLHLCEIRQ